jgi:hypothetical protein
MSPLAGLEFCEGLLPVVPLRSTTGYASSRPLRGKEIANKTVNDSDFFY